MRVRKHVCWSLVLLFLACSAVQSPQIIRHDKGAAGTLTLQTKHSHAGHARGLHEASAQPAAGGAAKHHEFRFPHRQAWHYQPSVPYHILDRSRGYMGDDNRLRVRAHTQRGVRAHLAGYTLTLTATCTCQDRCVGTSCPLACTSAPAPSAAPHRTAPHHTARHVRARRCLPRA